MSEGEDSLIDATLTCKDYSSHLYYYEDVYVTQIVRLVIIGKAHESMM
jgi:hypothetical protein